MNLRLQVFTTSFNLLVAVSLVGCGGTPSSDDGLSAERDAADQRDVDRDDADHAEDVRHDNDLEADGEERGDRPTSAFVVALTDLEETCNEIESGFVADDIARAHGPLHEVGDRLNDVQEAAANESLSDADQQRVEEAVGSLMKCFATLDDLVHSGEAGRRSYDKVAGRIDDAREALKSIEESIGQQ